MSVRHAILGLLAEGPLHGYELRSAYENELVPQSRLNAGQVYATLDRLLRDGLVHHEVVAQNDRPDKKVFALTAQGRDELGRWLGHASKVDLDLRNETFLKLMVARRLPEGDWRGVIALERRGAFERLHQATQARARADRDATPLSITLLLDLAVLKLEGLLEWLDRCEEALGKETP
ncbi:MAG: PadR family transcriptional regulator [Planctomycetes bacterium]|nr:PadR family transcriptional regulator [Planctomycetota bacterium]